MYNYNTFVFIICVEAVKCGLLTIEVFFLFFFFFTDKGIHTETVDAAYKYI